MSVQPEQEKKVKIDQLWLYPVRGVKGIEVDSCELTPYGIKYDRNWVIVDLVKMKSVANHNSHLITFLRQEILEDKDGMRLRLFLQDKECFPNVKEREKYIYFNQKEDQQKLVEAAKNVRGYKESDDVCVWLSEILGLEVIILRAQEDRLMTLDKERLPQALDSDRRSAFVTDGAIHLVNKQSCNKLLL